MVSIAGVAMCWVRGPFHLPSEPFWATVTLAQADCSASNTYHTPSVALLLTIEVLCH